MLNTWARTTEVRSNWNTKGFTVKQLEMIGNNAQDEVQRVIADIENRLVLTEDLSDLLK